LGKIAFSPDGNLLATSDLEKGLKLWRMDTRAPYMEMIEADDPVGVFPISMAFSPDGTKLAAVGFDYHIRVWDTNTGKLLAENDEFTFDVNQIAYKQNDEFIILSNAHLTKWNFAFDEHSVNQEIDGQLLAVSPERNLLATVKGLKTQLWNLQTLSHLATVQSHRSAVTDLVFSPDGSLLAIGGDDGNTLPDERGRLRAASKVYVWNTANQSGQTILEIVFQRALAFSPDSTLLAVGCRDDKVRLWDLARNAEQAVLETGFSLSFKLCFSHDGSLLAVGLDKGAIQIWDAHTHEKRLTIRPFTQPVTGLQFTHDGLTLACADWQNNIELWDVEKGARMAVLEGHRGYIRDITLSPDGKILASASADGSVRLWGVAENV
jgi:WD40 repeat protein